MKESLFFISAKLLRNQIRMLLNWRDYGDNKAFVILILLIVSPVLIYFSKYLGDQSSLESQIASVLIPLFLPLYFSKYYSSFFLKEKKLLKSYFSKMELRKVHLVLLHVCSLGIFIFLLLFGIVPNFNGVGNYWLIAAEVAIMVSYNFVLSSRLENRTTASRGKFINGLWDVKIKSDKFFPIRGIVYRELLYNWRMKKMYLLKTLLTTLFYNVILTLFIRNNNLSDLFFVVVIFQYVLLLAFVMQYSVSNDIQLSKNFSGTNFSVISGQFIFFIAVSFFYLTLTFGLFSLLLVKFDVLFLSYSFIGYMFLLMYILVVKQAYLFNSVARNLIYIMILLPITIPFVSINCIKRLR